MFLVRQKMLPLGRQLWVRFAAPDGWARGRLLSFLAFLFLRDLRELAWFTWFMWFMWLTWFTWFTWFTCFTVIYFKWFTCFTWFTWFTSIMTQAQCVDWKEIRAKHVFDPYVKRPFWHQEEAISWAIRVRLTWFLHGLITRSALFKIGL